MKFGARIVGPVCWFCIAGAFSASAQASEVCSYQQSQDSMLRFNNIMQDLNLEIVKIQAAGEPIPSDLYEKLTRMVDESTPLNKMMGQFSSTESMQPSSAVDPAICQGYDDLIESYGGEEDGAVQADKNPKCGQESLWARYVEAMQEVNLAVKEQRISSEEVDQLRVLDVQIGLYSTTDLGKACRVLEEYESKVGAIQ